MSNAEESKTSRDETAQNASPSKIDVMDKIIAELSEDQPKASESQSLALPRPRGRCSPMGTGVDRTSAGDWIAVDVPYTTDPMQWIFNHLRTNRLQALQGRGLAGPSLGRRFSSIRNFMSVLQRFPVTPEQLRVTMGAPPVDSPTSGVSLATADGPAGDSTPIMTIATYTLPAFRHYIEELISSASTGSASAVSERCEIRPASSAPLLVQPASESRGVEGSLSCRRTTSMSDIVVRHGAVESADVSTIRSESDSSPKPVTEVGCNDDNAVEEQTTTPVSARRRSSLWSRTKKFVRLMFCCSAKDMPLD